MTVASERPTVRAVVRYAEQLRERADRAMALDPWARPYYPTSAGARKLVERATAERRREALQIGLTGDELDDYVAEAPAIALERLRRRAAQVDAENREADELGSRARKRHARRRAQTRRDLDAARAELSPGDRIDATLRALQTFSEVAAAVMDSDPVDGGKPGSRAPRWIESAYDGAVRDVDALLRRLEGRVDHVRGLAAPERRTA